jgi:hypothetical protein
MLPFAEFCTRVVDSGRSTALLQKSRNRAVLTDSPELDGELTVLRETLFGHESNRDLFARRIRAQFPGVSQSLDALHVDSGKAFTCLP